MATDLISFTSRGLYCSAADVYIDPWQPVDRAIITHAHSDHAYRGHRLYLAHRLSVPIMKYRLGADINVQSVEYNEKVIHNGVKFSFYPAGHIPGSSQIRVEYKDEVWVASGDYKRDYDNISSPFEIVKCHAFITESTFGLPVYNWSPSKEIFENINQWWRNNASIGKASVITGYPLGKAQRILMNVDRSIGKIFLHGSIYNINNIFIENGLSLPYIPKISDNNTKEEISTSLIIAQPSAAGSLWLRRFEPYSLAIASGWMNIRGAKRRRTADAGFALSDHADWRALNETVKDTGAEKIFVTHGFTDTYSQWLREQGYDAHEVKTEYRGEIGEISEGDENISVATEQS